MTDRPKLQILDDPLRTTPAAAPTETQQPQPAEPRPAKPERPRTQTKPIGLDGEEAQAVFARVPKSLARRLEGAVYELRGADPSVRQQQMLVALLWRYVDPADRGSLKELAALVSEYKGALKAQRNNRR